MEIKKEIRLISADVTPIHGEPLIIKTANERYFGYYDYGSKNNKPAGYYSLESSNGVNDSNDEFIENVEYYIYMDEL